MEPNPFLPRSTNQSALKKMSSQVPLALDRGYSGRSRGLIADSPSEGARSEKVYDHYAPSSRSRELRANDRYN